MPDARAFVTIGDYVVDLNAVTHAQVSRDKNDVDHVVLYFGGGTNTVVLQHAEATAMLKKLREQAWPLPI